MPDLVRLRILAAVAAHGSVAKAAKHLKYSQPAVSHHPARIEAETGPSRHLACRHRARRSRSRRMLA
jgi:molybdenum-dependent DNA-binding transcriptional regulator ModE